MSNPHVEGKPVSHSTYVNHKCRCDGCREANRVANAKMRERRRSSPVPEGQHGQNGYTNYGCRCHTCRKGHNAYSNVYQAALRGLASRHPEEFAALLRENDR